LVSELAFLLGAGLIVAGALVTSFGWHEVGHMVRQRLGLSDD
jgi:hypothetical protein